MANAYFATPLSSNGTPLGPARVIGDVPETREVEDASWDEVASTLGGPMIRGKKANDDSDLQRLIAILEKYSGDREEVEDATPESRALQHLQSIRPAIERSGDRHAIDAFNSAVGALKRSRSSQTRLVGDARSPQRAVTFDSDPDVAADYEAAIRAARERMLRGEKSTGETTGHPTRGRTQDSERVSDDSWVDSHREAGRKMREKKH
jgi:hypothetical protein